MPSSRTALAALPALPAGTIALLARSAPYALAAVLLCTVLAALPTLADTVMRWRTTQRWLEQEGIRNEALRRIGRDDPERVVALLPPAANPFERRPSPAEGPAPPEPASSAPTGR
jgi:hypothetical protein